MTYRQDEDVQTKPTVALVCNFSYLGLGLFSQLENNSCRPLIFSEDIAWRDTFNEKGIDTSYLIDKEKSESDIFIDYIICISTSDQKINNFDSTKKLFSTAKELSKNFSAKSLYIFDYFLNNENLKRINEFRDEIINDNEMFSGVLFINDFVTVSEEKNNYQQLISNFLKVNYDIKQITLLKKSSFYIINFDQLISQIIRCLFSFKAYGTSTAILTRPIPAARITSVIEDKINGMTVSYKNEGLSPIDTKEKIVLNSQADNEIVGLIKVIQNGIQTIKDAKKEEIYEPEIKIPVTNLEKEIKLTEINKINKEPKIKSKKQLIAVEYFQKLKSANKLRATAFKTKHSNLFDTHKYYKRKFRIVSLFAALYFLIPISMIVFGAMLFNIGNFLLARSDPKITDKFFRGSLATSMMIKVYAQYPSQVPVIGTYFRQLQNSAEVLEKLNNLNIRSLVVTENLFNLTKDFLERGKYNPNKLQLSYIELDYVYNLMGFLEAELKNDLLSTKIISYLTVDEKELNKKRSEIKLLKQIVEFAPSLLGKDKPTSYLILFQDNHVLRPTGGEIKKIGLASFTNGELVEFKMYNTDEIDSTLQGMVAPPAPLKKYFNISSWYISDANWDPDFPTSAAKAEWFIDKALDKPVDGVVAVNSEFLNNLRFFDSELVKKSDNHANAVNENHPVNINIEQSLKEISKAYSGYGYVSLLNNLSFISNSLKAKDVQLFINNDRGLSLLSDNAIDGALVRKECQGNCYSDILNIIEYGSKGTNSQNVIRQASLNISLEEKLIKRRLVYFIENKSSDIYKTYFRVIVPGGTGFSPVKIVKKESSDEVVPDVTGYRGFKEAGQYIEIKPNETVALMYSWENGVDYNLEKDGEYWFNWRAQSGIKTLPVDIKIEKPANLHLSSQPGFSLTEDNLLGYNTNLSQDFFSRILWNK